TPLQSPVRPRAAEAVSPAAPVTPPPPRTLTAATGEAFTPVTETTPARAANESPTKIERDIPGKTTKYTYADGTEVTKTTGSAYPNRTEIANARAAKPTTVGA